MGAYADRDKLLLGMGFESYKAYRGSDLWKGIRRRAFDRDNRKCRCCSKRADVIHHHSYDLWTLKGENIDQLFALCDPCHERVEFDGETKRSFRQVREALGRLLAWKTGDKPAKKIKRKCKKRGLLVGQRGTRPVRDSNEIYREREQRLRRLAAKPDKNPVVAQIMAARDEWDRLRHSGAKASGKVPSYFKLKAIERMHKNKRFSTEYERHVRLRREIEQREAVAAERSREAHEKWLALQETLRLDRLINPEDYLPTFEGRIKARIAKRQALEQELLCEV